MLLRASSDGACLPDTGCVAAKQTLQAPVTLTADVTAGETYFVVVDSHDGAASAFSLSLTCP